MGRSVAYKFHEIFKGADHVGAVIDGVTEFKGPVGRDLFQIDQAFADTGFKSVEKHIVIKIRERRWFHCS